MLVNTTRSLRNLLGSVITDFILLLARLMANAKVNAARVFVGLSLKI
jgi:hypothetical protein